MMRILMVRQRADLQHVTDAQLQDAEAHLLYMREMKDKMEMELERKRKLREAEMERTSPYRLMRLKQIQSAGRTPDQR